MVTGTPGPAVTAGNGPAPPRTPSPEVWIQGAFPEGTEDDARRAITALLGEWGELLPVRGARIRLSAHRDPAVHFPVVAQGNLNLGARLVRAQVHAATGREAIAALQARLGHQLHRAADISRGAAAWAEHRLPTSRVTYFPRPPAQRRLVRCKPWRLALLGVDEAVAELERRDYDFHLFIEVGTGQDSVIYHAGPVGYRLAQLCPAPDRLAPYTVALSCYDRPAPTLRIAEAVGWLGLCDVPFLLFRGTASGRGRVLYRRYNGHYGLICPPGTGAGAGVPRQRAS